MVPMPRNPKPLALVSAALLLLGGAGLLLSSCQEEEPMDRVQPVLTVFAPAQGGTYTVGSEIIIDFEGSDDVELALWVININNLDAGKSVLGLSDQINAPTVSVTRSFQPTETGPTNYEIIISLIDAAQNEAIVTKRFSTQL
jgi:hypothetical protein